MYAHIISGTISTMLASRRIALRPNFVAILFWFLGFGFFGISSALAQELGEPRMLMVTGEGDVTKAAEIADLTVLIANNGGTAAAALQMNAEASRALLALLRAQKIESRDIQTLDLTLEPRGDGQSGTKDNNEQSTGAQTVGYRASNQMVVRVRGLARAAELIDVIAAAGKVEITSIVFGIADRAAVIDEAVARAIEDGRRKAQKYAQAAGVKLGLLQSIAIEAPPPSGESLPLGNAPRDPSESRQLTVRAKAQLSFRVSD